MNVLRGKLLTSIFHSAGLSQSPVRPGELGDNLGRAILNVAREADSMAQGRGR